MVSFSRITTTLALIAAAHQTLAGAYANANGDPGLLKPRDPPTANGVPATGGNGMPAGNNGTPAGNNGAPVGNNGTPAGNNGTPTANNGCATGTNAANGNGCGATNAGTTTTNINGGANNGGIDGGNTGGTNGGTNTNGGTTGGGNGGCTNGGDNGDCIPIVITTGTPTTGSVLGDPHLKTLDGAHFDFMKAGTFTLVDSPKGLKVQATMKTCDKSATCTTGVAVGYHGTVVRFTMQGNKISPARGSDLGALTVKQAAGNKQGYRVFINNDPSSSYFKEGTKGVIAAKGDADALAKEYGVTGANLLSCTDCSDLAGAVATVPLATTNQWADQGYKTLKAEDIPLKSVRRLREAGNAPDATTTKHNAAAVKPLDEGKVKALCAKTLQSIPHCAKLVKPMELYRDSVCVKDTMLLGDLQRIDKAKLVYLRQCRRVMDIHLHQNDTSTTNNNSESQSATQVDSIKQQRTELKFGTAEKCPKGCNGKGKCLVIGCQCDQGFTGHGCSIAM